MPICGSCHAVYAAESTVDRSNDIRELRRRQQIVPDVGRDDFCRHAENVSPLSFLLWLRDSLFVLPKL